MTITFTAGYLFVVLFFCTYGFLSLVSETLTNANKSNVAYAWFIVACFAIVDTIRFQLTIAYRTCTMQVRLRENNHEYINISLD